MTKNVSTIDRTRKDFWIFSAEARSTDERAQTAMKAAVDLRSKYPVLVARVFLVNDRAIAGQGGMTASAVWTPDGQGFSGVEKTEWEVETVDDHGYHPYNPKKK